LFNRPIAIAAPDQTSLRCSQRIERRKTIKMEERKKKKKKKKNNEAFVYKGIWNHVPENKSVCSVERETSVEYRTKELYWQQLGILLNMINRFCDQEYKNVNEKKIMWLVIAIANAGGSISALSFKALPNFQKLETREQMEYERVWKQNKI